MTDTRDAQSHSPRGEDRCCMAAPVGSAHRFFCFECGEEHPGTFRQVIAHRSKSHAPSDRSAGPRSSSHAPSGSISFQHYPCRTPAETPAVIPAVTSESTVMGTDPNSEQYLVRSVHDLSAAPGSQPEGVRVLPLSPGETPRVCVIRRAVTHDRDL